MRKDYLKYILSVLLFGSNGIVASHIGLSSYEIVLCRTMIGSALLIVVFFLTGQKPKSFNHKKSFLYIVLSGIAMGTSWMFLYEAYAQIGVSLASLTYHCGPVIVMALSPVLFKEKMTWTKIAGFSAVFIGILLVNGRADGNISRWGIFCGLMSAVTYSMMVILNKKSTAINGLENSAIQLLSGFATVAVFTVIKTGCHIHIGTSDLMWIIILGVINTGVGCYLYFSSIGRIPAQTVAILGYIEPLSAVTLAVVLLGEKMTFIQYAGAVLIVGGALFGECYKSKKIREVRCK